MVSDEERAAKKAKFDRQISVWILSAAALASLVFIVPHFGLTGLVVWIVYFAFGGLWMRLGIFLIGILAEDPNVKLDWWPAVIYLSWPVSVAALLATTFVVQFFRFALDFTPRR